MEHKTVQLSTKVLDETQGIVETVFAVMGNVDYGKDMIHNGAFTKTFSERGSKVKVLDQHRSDSVQSVVGKPLELRELGRGELPATLLQQYPDATGGAWAKVQFLLDTPEGLGVFNRIKAGAVDEWSFGYDALDKDYDQIQIDGKEVTIRNLRTLKLYELSPVIWGMNPATTTVSAKADGVNVADIPDGGEFLEKIVQLGERYVADEITWEEAKEELIQLYNMYLKEEDMDSESEDMDSESQDMENEDSTPPEGGDEDPVDPEAGAEDSDTEAGPDEDDGPPTTEVDLMSLIRLEQERIQLLELEGEDDEV